MQIDSEVVGYMVQDGHKKAQENVFNVVYDPAYRPSDQDLLALRKLLPEDSQWAEQLGLEEYEIMCLLYSIERGIETVGKMEG